MDGQNPISVRTRAVEFSCHGLLPRCVLTKQVAIEARRSRLTAARTQLPLNAESALRHLEGVRLSLIAAVLARMRELEDGIRAAYAAKCEAVDAQLLYCADLAKKASKLTGDALQAVAVMGDVDVLANAPRLRVMVEELRAAVEDREASAEDATLDIRLCAPSFMSMMTQLGEIVTMQGGLSDVDAASFLELLPLTVEASDTTPERATLSSPPAFRVVVSEAVRARFPYNAATVVRTIARGLAVSAIIEDSAKNSAPLTIFEVVPSPRDHCVSVVLRVPPEAHAPGVRVTLVSVTVSGFSIHPARGPPLPRIIATLEAPSLVMLRSVQSRPFGALAFTPAISALRGTAVYAAVCILETAEISFIPHPPRVHVEGSSPAASPASWSTSEMGFVEAPRGCAFATGDSDILVVVGLGSAGSRIVALDVASRTLLWSAPSADLNGVNGVCVVSSLRIALVSSCFDSRIFVVSLLDGTCVGCIDCAKSGFRWPTCLAADDRSKTVFASVLLPDNASHTVAAWRWNEGVPEEGSAAAAAGGPTDAVASQKANEGSWALLGSLQGVPKSRMPHVLAVVGASPQEAGESTGSSSNETSSLVVGTLGSSDFVVIALPSLRVASRRGGFVSSASSSAIRGTQALTTTAAPVCGLAGDPGGAWLAWQSVEDGSLAWESWPLCEEA